MAEIVITTKNGKGGKSLHTHLVYLRDNMSALMAESSGHTHPVYYRPDEPQAIDEDPTSMFYGQVVKEAVPGGWTIDDGGNGHTHEIDVPFSPPVPKDKKEATKDIVNDVLAMYAEASAIEERSRIAAYESDKMYKPRGLWNEKTKKDLISNSRAALEINKIESKIDNLSGYQRQNRTDCKCLPNEDGDQVIADVLNYIIKNITENCNYAREETKVFDDQMIVGRGSFNAFDDRNTNIEGDIVLERWKWDEVRYGPHEKEDLSDCDYIVKEKWYSLAKLKEMYPEHAENFQPQSKYMEISAYSRSDDWDKRLSTLAASSVGGTELSNSLKKQYKLLECWRKVYRSGTALSFHDDGFVINADGWKKADIDAIKTIEGFSVISRVTYRMRVTKQVVALLVSDDYPDLAINDFHMVPAYAKKRDNEFWGKIEGVKDLQSAIVKVYSQFIDILNRMAAYGWFYDDNTFLNREDERKFKKNSSKPGFVQKITDVSNPPKKEEGIKFPNELVSAIAAFNTDLREIMNINLELAGIGQSANESGVALRQKIVQQLLGNDYIFDNLSFAKKKLFKIVIAMIQKIYTARRIMRILGNQAMREKKMELAGKPYGEYDKEGLEVKIDEALQKEDLTKYDITISEAPSSPTAQLSNFLFLLELAGKGVQIPPMAFFQFAPIPNKEKIIEQIQMAAQQAKESEDKKYNTEIAKTMIGKGVMPGDGGVVSPQEAAMPGASGMPQ